MNSALKNQPNVVGYSIKQLTKIIPLGRTSIYKLIGEGRLRSVVICGRRIIPADEIEALLAPNSKIHATHSSKEASLQAGPTSASDTIFKIAQDSGSQDIANFSKNQYCDNQIACNGNDLTTTRTVDLENSHKTNCKKRTNLKSRSFSTQINPGFEHPKKLKPMNKKHFFKKRKIARNIAPLMR